MLYSYQIYIWAFEKVDTCKTRNTKRERMQTFSKAHIMNRRLKKISVAKILL